mmetsp:Transcript_19751/g.44845  ORF Transcript_19751/g.44845 Transcript_19751/m.44845 type:complete len:105 (-) Transcript_19751:95-409(-)|eukprot:CAMPEP_0113326164 /NCGR_PEP_ID=MMETSP0010_2-20120614/18314_1 /TAXON_ID=216773 ORGANISM="Corethron hystrix, Strain 308" /NCGR_SAMPLE_ID=MMETSP0010_2 /ASSEMBLY_ACC=CAM_ASM_000155 /LENGTH=104 /DNA_ID=CAMNT_0000186355 /DNA_START=39 /DNA_END=353 /DNA_ORIENTATION=- /assembly_acc=CAM_ASM_000155
MVFPGFHSLLKRVPGGDQVRVLVGTSVILALGAAPIAFREFSGGGGGGSFRPPEGNGEKPIEAVRRGHGYFDSEKPIALEEIEVEKEKKRRKELVERIDGMIKK